VVSDGGPVDDLPDVDHPGGPPMLTCLRVRDFAIIDRLELELGPGLNVVTGETGAGKSILVDALSLVLGGRARPEVIRSGAESAEVEALFDLSASPEALARVEAAGVAASEGELVVRRVVLGGGRTRAYVNGRLATATQLAELAAGLVDVSSQHEHHSLTDPSTHLGYLDAYARLEARRHEMARAYATLTAAEEALAKLRAAVSGRATREDVLRFQLREIEEVAPVPGERERLREEREVLRHAESLARSAASAEEAVYSGERAVVDVLGRVEADLVAAARLDTRFEPLVQELAEARTRLEEVGRELGRRARAIASDPERLAEVEGRLDRLQRLERKYGGSTEAVLAHAAAVREELATLEDHEARAAELEAAVERAREEALRIADTLGAARRAAARELGAAIGAELESVGLRGATLQVAVTRLDARDDGGVRLTATGYDRVELLIAPNRGEEARPLRKIASGGELSRALLAIKRVLAGLRPAGLYVFDEVDTGVGGAVAEVIGRKLKDVARHHQVLCITHLPQIAVFADRHYRVTKEEVDGRTRSVVEALSPSERREEVARMLGGMRITSRTRAAAAEMLRDAR
jgi:DNA repair protein RecN (Recombination protein N)